MTWRSCLKWAASALTQIISSWVILLTEGPILLKHSYFWLLWKWDIQKESLWSEVIMKVDRLRRYMAFTMSALENSDQSMCGGTAQIYLIISLSQPSSITKSSVFMVVLVLQLTHSMRSDRSKENKRCPMMVLCATSCGATLMSRRAGVWVLEVQVTSLAATSSRSSTARTKSIWFAEPISSSWRVTNPCSTTRL